MRYRYLIEKAEEDVYLTTITRSDTGGRATRVNSVEAAQALAATDPELRGEELKWKDPPQEWQPDAILISQWLDDDVKENRDD